MTNVCVCVCVDVVAYAGQLETLLTEKIDALTKLRGQFAYCVVS